MNEELQEQTALQADPEAPEAPREKKPRKNPLRRLKAVWSNRKRRKWLILGAVLLVLVLFVLRGCMQMKSAMEAMASGTYVSEPAAYRGVYQSLSGSGTLQPANSYVVTTLKEGEVLSADFRKGDTVTKDTVLYQLDSSDAGSNVEKSQLNLDQAQRSYEKAAYAGAPISGEVAVLNVKAGDTVSPGEVVATVRDSGVMTLKVPFAADDAASFRVGQTASVTLDGSFEVLTGRVIAVSSADAVLTGSRIVRYVTISLANPGGLSDSQLATAVINNCGSSSGAALEYKSAVDVVASAGGTVAAVNVREGGSVSAGAPIVTFASNAGNDTVQSAADNLRSAELSMQAARDQLEDYTITSPIDGTIVDKQYKAGDTVEAGKSLCTIYDLSYLKLTMNIDELDVSQLTEGQEVTVTADAVEGRTYRGVVTEISMAGATSNGRTSYPVTVRIDESEGLWPGMNVDAEIVVASNDNALSIPAAAVERGNKVLVTAASPSAANALEDPSPAEGYVYVPVETGVSDNDYIEIKSGLQEGDVVGYLPAATGTDPYSMMMGAAAPAGGGGGPEGGPRE